MAFDENGRAGVVKEIKTALDLMSRWDNSEDVTVGAADVTLTAGVMGDGASGVGDGKSRANYYCYGIHNATSSGATIKYEDIKGGSGATFTIYIPAGGWAMPLIRVTKIKGTGTGTTAATIKLLYKDRYAVDQTGIVQSVTE